METGIIAFIGRLELGTQSWVGGFRNFGLGATGCAVWGSSFSGTWWAKDEQ